jgi:hypothetical protein
VTPVYFAQNLTDARLLADQLEGEGVKTYIRNEALQGALGELPLTLRPEVCVLAEAEVERARGIVAEYEKARTSTLHSADQLCGFCGEQSPGNFEVCWKCRQPFAEH